MTAILRKFASPMRLAALASLYALSGATFCGWFWLTGFPPGGIEGRVFFAFFLGLSVWGLGGTAIAASALVESERETEQLSDRLRLLKNHRRAATENETLYRLFYEGTPGAMLVVWGERILELNPAFSREFGYSDEEILGRELSDLFTEAVQVDLGQPGVRATARRKDSSQFGVWISWSPGKYRGKDVALVVLTSQAFEAVAKPKPQTSAEEEPETLLVDLTEESPSGVASGLEIKPTGINLQTKKGTLNMATKTKAPAIDAEIWKTLRDLEDSSGSDVIRALVPVFVNDTALKFSKLSQCLQKQDWKEIVQIAHNLKSSAANMGALNLSKLLVEIERAAQAGDGGRVASQAEAARAEFEDAKLEITALTRGEDFKKAG